MGRGAPGPPFRPLDIEDRFLTEAAWRITHRNASYHNGDWYSAWHENLILERYFPAALDLAQVIDGTRSAPDVAERFPHGWPDNRLTDGQRAELEASLPDPLPHRYTSPVLPGRIYAFSRVAFWATVLVLCAGALALTRRR